MRNDEEKQPGPDRKQEPGPAESTDDCDDTVTIAPPDEKVGEDGDNLARREEWSRKRGGRA